PHSGLSSTAKTAPHPAVRMTARVGGYASSATPAPAHAARTSAARTRRVACMRFPPFSRPAGSIWKEKAFPPSLVPQRTSALPHFFHLALELCASLVQHALHLTSLRHHHQPGAHRKAEHAARRHSPKRRHPHPAS